MHRHRILLKAIKLGRGEMSYTCSAARRVARVELSDEEGYVRLQPQLALVSYSAVYYTSIEPGRLGRYLQIDIDLKFGVRAPGSHWRFEPFNMNVSRHLQRQALEAVAFRLPDDVHISRQAAVPRLGSQGGARSTAMHRDWADEAGKST